VTLAHQRAESIQVWYRRVLRKTKCANFDDARLAFAGEGEGNYACIPYLFSAGRLSTSALVCALSFERLQDRLILKVQYCILNTVLPLWEHDVEYTSSTRH